jgi:hypothetical protein
MYNIKAIPSLCIIGQDDTIITVDGRSEVNDDPEADVSYSQIPDKIEIRV